MNNVFINNVVSKLGKITIEDIATQSGFDKSDDVYHSIDNLCNFFRSDKATKKDVLNLLALYFDVTYSGYVELDRQFVECLIDNDLETASNLLPKLKTQITNTAVADAIDAATDKTMNRYMNVVFNTLDIFLLESPLTQ